MARTIRTSLAVLLLLAVGCSADGDDAADEPVDPGTAAPTVRNDLPWPMHPIDSRFRGANGLGQGDVNGDGLDDFATNYEFDQRFEIALHPGPRVDPRTPWPTVTAFVPDPLTENTGINAESAALGDLDGDGNTDLLGGQGWSDIPGIEGNQAGARIVWGPGGDAAADPEAWVDGGRLAATIDGGHFHWVQVHDVNEDGLLDGVLAGRVHGGTGEAAGIRWLEAPEDPAQRRDLDQWQVHTIVEDQPGTHGAVFADIDEDGDADITLVNADFDTDDADEALVWYENPGPGPDQAELWVSHEIYAGPEFDGKPQVAVADLDGDGFEDLLTQTARDIYWFRKTATDPVTFDRVVITKDPVAQQFSRPIAVADLDGDDRLDIVGGLVHEESTLAPDRASVFWMSYDGDRPAADNWTTHVIKWGSGTTSLVPSLGEKWDQFRVVDVDGDDDPDIVANNEEWWIDLYPKAFSDQDPEEAMVGVVWFENRLADDPYTFEEVDGLVAVETEHRTDDPDGSWVIRNRDPGFGGEGYLQSAETIETTPAGAGSSPGSTFTIDVAGGRYQVWARTLVPEVWGSQLGGAASDEAWVVVDDGPPLRIGGDRPPTHRWAWVRAEAPLELDSGRHTLSLRTREGGYAVDRIVLTTARGADAPTGVGPTETRAAP